MRGIPSLLRCVLDFHPLGAPRRRLEPAGLEVILGAVPDYAAGDLVEAGRVVDAALALDPDVGRDLAPASHHAPHRDAPRGRVVPHDLHVVGAAANPLTR